MFSSRNEKLVKNDLKNKQNSEKKKVRTMTPQKLSDLEETFLINFQMTSEIFKINSQDDYSDKAKKRISSECIYLMEKL